MVSTAEPVKINRSLIEQLAIDAMLLADEAESYFSGGEDPECGDLPMEMQVEFACEAFRTTALLKHLIERLARPEDAAKLGLASIDPPSPSLDFSRLPPKARAIVAATHALYLRVQEMDRHRAEAAADPQPSPARMLQEQLAAAIRP